MHANSAFTKRFLPSDKGPPDARKLVLRIIDHDEIAFESLYLRFQKHVLGMAQRLVKSEDEAEEVLQDVFMALWRKPPALLYGLPSLLAWFAVTTRNQCWMRLRRSQYETLAKNTSTRGTYDDPVLERIAEAQLRSTLEKEFLRAPRKHRDVLKLTYYGDMGATEVANTLNLPVFTVRKRLQVAVTNLRRHPGLKENSSAVSHRDYQDFRCPIQSGTVLKRKASNGPA